MIHTSVVVGWTDPRGTRPFFGSLLLGDVDDQGELRYVGRAASGFSDADIGRVWKQVHALETKRSPLAVEPFVAGRVHWVKPKLGVQVKFSGWTRDGRLRRPVYAGLESDAKRQRTHGERHSIAADRTR
jgi:bifunctional non-homologous end joining protein LigD